MKKANLLLLLGGLCFMISSCNNESGITKSGKLEEVRGGEKRALLSELKKSGGLFYLNGILFTGVAFEMWDEKQFEREGTFKDGKADGPYKIYYKNGQLKDEGNYKEMKRDGLRKKYYENGKLEVEENYKDDKRDGLRKKYYKNGQLEVEENYKDDKRDGLRKKYYENGQLEDGGN